MSITSVQNDNIGDSSFINSQKPIPPTITGYSISGSDDTALDPAGGQTIFINGSGFQRGATITFDGSAISVVTWVSSSRLSFTSPAKSAGTYTIYVVNADTSTAIFIPGLIYSNLPSWTTSAGSLGSYYETTAISNTVVASGDAPVTYALVSGSLPTGATLSSNGVITGTAPVDSGSTTYSFTIEAIDAQLQSSTRSFSLTINTDVVTWTNPTNNATINLGSGSYSTTLTANSAAGYSISSFSANTLPTGLTLSGNTISGTPTTTGTVTTLLTATAATTNRSGTNTITWVISLGDAFWRNVTTLISPQTTAPFNDDLSTNNFNVTVNGDTRPNNVNPYTTGYYSVQFNGSNQYLQTSTYSAQLNPGSSDFTIEFWVFATASNRQDWFNLQAATGFNRILVYYTGSGNIQYDSGTGSAATSRISSALSSASLVSQWHHIALSRNSGTSRLFLDGVQIGSSFTDTQVWTENMQLTVFRDPGGTTYAAGNLSNARLLIGTGLYTSNFQVPSTPFTNITNTRILISQSNRFIDTSSNNLTITPFNTPIISSRVPFVPASASSTFGSTYFDGTGDFLSFTGSPATTLDAAFTFEAWVYPSSVSATQPIMCIGDAFSNPGLLFYIASDAKVSLGFNNARNFAGSGTVIANAWNHIAFVRSGSTITGYLNGVSQGTSTTSNTFSGTTTVIGREIYNTGVGAQFTGYISNLRLVKGTAVYTANFTPPTSLLTAISGTSLLTCQTNQPVNNNVFLDNSTNNFLIARQGNTTQGTFSPYGESWSVYFDGNGDSLTFTNTTGQGVNLGTGNFTVELWYYMTDGNTNTTYQAFLRQDSVTNGFDFGYRHGASQLVLGLQNVGEVTATATLSPNTWNHVAVSRLSNNLRFFVNGVQVGSTVSNTYDFGITGGTTRIGGSNFIATHNVIGYISNLRVTKSGTSTITVSTTPLTATENTTLLVCKDPNFTDDSPNNFTLTRNGDISTQKFSPFNGVTLPTPAYSVFFDGTGDYLITPASAVNQLTADFTIEFWVYATSLTGQHGIVNITNTTSSGTNGLAVYFETSNRVSYFVNGNGGTVTTTFTVTAGVWYHMALVRSGSTNRLYINGVERSTNSVTPTWPATPSIGIGRLYNDNTSFTLPGYISNLRILKGTALYTTNFTPPTSPLTAITNTLLLVCQSNTFIDNSTNNFAITVTGDARPITFNPFTLTYSINQSYSPSVNGGSMYFDGSDTISLSQTTLFAAANQDFTIECWVYRATVGNNMICGWDGAPNDYWYITPTDIGFNLNNTYNVSATFVIQANQWYHIALSRRSNVNRIFVNGIKVSGDISNSNSFGRASSLGIGDWTGGTRYYWLGYLSDFRFVIGEALYTSNFVPQNTPLQAVRNTTLLLNGTSAGIIDNTGLNVCETIGDAKEVTNIFKYGNTSMFFDGTGDYLSIPDSPNLEVGTGDFTIEAWIYIVAYVSGSAIISKGVNTSPYLIFIGASNELSFYGSAGSGWAVGDLRIANGPSLSTWHHIAVTRSGTTFRTFFNGTLANSLTYSGALADNSNPVIIGFYQASFNGYISDLRFTRGVARYTTNFTPPTVLFPTN